MQLVKLKYPITDIKQIKPSVLALGFFDGVHLGHQQVIRTACQLAKDKDLPCGIMTFYPHPKEVMGITNKIDQITPIESKIEQLDKLGVDICYLVHFDLTFASLSPKHFIDDFLLKLKVKGLVTGFDFTFGSKGLGTPETLIENSNGNYSVKVVGPYFDSGEKVSSTRVRDGLLNGRISEVTRLLGRNYSFKGEVVHGEKRGRQIGFPTVNLRLLEDYLSIKKGVYVVTVKMDGELYTGVMNVGVKPTFEDTNMGKTYEIYILDFNKEIYGKQLEVELLDYIREEKKFANVHNLKSQIAKDVQYAKSTGTDMAL